MKRKGDVFSVNSKGQVWIETVIYTLIAFVMIGLVLGFARPKIEELQDKAIIDKTVAMMKDIDAMILDIGVPGNQRVMELGIRKGIFKIDTDQDVLVFEIESKHVYSEIDQEVVDGNLKIETTKTGSANLVTLTRDYSGSYDLQYEEADLSTPEELGRSSIAYQLLIVNKGGTGTTVIDFSLV